MSDNPTALVLVAQGSEEIEAVISIEVPQGARRRFNPVTRGKTPFEHEAVVSVTETARARLFPNESA